MHTPSIAAPRDNAEPLKSLPTSGLSAGSSASFGKAPSSLDVMGMPGASARRRPRQFGEGRRGGFVAARLRLRESDAFRDDIDGAALHLAIHARDVFADDAEREQLDAAEELQCQEHRGV